MGRLQLPSGAEAGFRLTDTDAFGCSLRVHLYGAGRDGWFLVSRRFPGHNHDTGRQTLDEGQWLTFLDLVDQARFWDLPEEWPGSEPENSTVDDGEWLALAGRRGERYHRIHRFIWREPGLDAVLLFCRQLPGAAAPIEPQREGQDTPSIPHPP